MAVGGSLSLLPRFDAGTALEIIERDRATVFEGVPTMYAAMLHHPEPADTSSLQLCVSGGAAMPVEVLRAFEQSSSAQCSRATARRRHLPSPRSAGEIANASRARSGSRSEASRCDLRTSTTASPKS